MRIVNFKNQKVLIIDKRIHKDNTHKNLNFYYLRHSDTDWSKVVTIEESVIVNLYGTLISLNEIKWNKDDYYTLNEKEIEEFSYGGEFIEEKVNLKDVKTIKSLLK